VWVTKYRHKVLQGAMRERIREIIRQTCDEIRVHIVWGVLGRAGARLHAYVSVDPAETVAVGRDAAHKRLLSRRVQMEFPELGKRYWGRRFWAHEYFSTMPGNVTADIILQYLELNFKQDVTGFGR
jgi:putative transposase